MYINLTVLKLKIAYKILNLRSQPSLIWSGDFSGTSTSSIHVCAECRLKGRQAN